MLGLFLLVGLGLSVHRLNVHGLPHGDGVVILLPPLSIFVSSFLGLSLGFHESGKGVDEAFLDSLLLGHFGLFDLEVEPDLALSVAFLLLLGIVRVHRVRGGFLRLDLKLRFDFGGRRDGLRSMLWRALWRLLRTGLALLVGLCWWHGVALLLLLVLLATHVVA